MNVIPTIPNVAALSPGTSAWAQSVKAAYDFSQRRTLCWVTISADAARASDLGFVPLTWDTVITDYFGMFDGSQPTRITPDLDQPCYLRIHAFCRYETAAGGWRGLQVRANGSYVPATLQEPPTPSAQTPVDWDRVMGYSPGDYYELMVAQTSGSTLGITAGSNITGFQVEFVSLA